MPTTSLQRDKIPRNECPVYETKQPSCNARALGNAGHPFIAIASRSALIWSGST